jgi:HlyD family secretion protein
MNYESRIQLPADETTSQQTWDDGAATRRDAGRRRLAIGVAIGVVALALVGAWYSFGAADGEAAASTAAAATEGEGANSAPRVTVMLPGRQLVESVITATGSLSARREMPVGVAGEGGQVVRVLVEPGQWVRAGQVLAVVDRAVQNQQLAQLDAQIRVAQADAQLAQAELARAQALSGRGFISRSDLDRRAATRDAAVARVRVAQAQRGESVARTGRLDVRAPAAGLVLTRGVEPGQVISAGSGVLFRIARGGEMELLAAVGEADLTRINVGASATVTPVGAARGFTGQIWQIAPVIDAQTRQGTARIALSYAPGLRPGGFAQARIIAGAAQSPLLPESAVMDDADGNFVFIIGRDNKVARRAVTVGQINDSGIPIMSGLDGTERIVVSAGAFLNIGDTVRPVTAAPAPAAASPAPAPAR